MDFCQFTPVDNLTLGDSACGKDVYSVRAFWRISVWILDGQSLFVLIVQQNVEVPLQLDHRLSWIDMILSLNNKNLKKAHIFLLAMCISWGLRVEKCHQIENISYGEQHEEKAAWRSTWKHCTALKNSSAQLPLENLIHSLDVFLWLSISSHLAGSLTQPSPQDPSAFVKRGHKNLSNPSTLFISSHFRIAWYHTTGSWQTAQLRPDVLSSLYIWKLLFFVPLWDRYSALPRPMGREEWDENEICQHQQDWQVKPT